MADFVLDATQVGEVVTYVAPGFLAQVGYRTHYPAPERSAGFTLILSVVASLPLVALANALIGGSHEPTQLAYVVLLTVGSFLVGYVLALIRGQRRVKDLLARLGYRIEPEGTIYAQTLKHMSASAEVVVELKDGRRVRGTPRSGPQAPDDGINELYFTNPRAEWVRDDWRPVGAGLIVPLAEISNIALSEDPTGASTAPEPDARVTNEPLAEPGAPSDDTDSIPREPPATRKDA